MIAIADRPGSGSHQNAAVLSLAEVMQEHAQIREAFISGPAHGGQLFRRRLRHDNITGEDADMRPDFPPRAECGIGREHDLTGEDMATRSFNPAGLSRIDAQHRGILE